MSNQHSISYMVHNAIRWNNECLNSYYLFIYLLGAELYLKFFLNCCQVQNKNFLFFDLIGNKRYNFFFLVKTIIKVK